MDTRDSTNDKLRALPYNFTEFGANCTVRIHCSWYRTSCYLILWPCC